MLLGTKKRVNNEDFNKLTKKVDGLEKRMTKFEKRTTVGNNVVLRVPNEVRPKLFKVDTKVLAKWEKFVAEHREYKIQHLISVAIDEFVEKYKDKL